MILFLDDFVFPLGPLIFFNAVFLAPGGLFGFFSDESYSTLATLDVLSTGSSIVGACRISVLGILVIAINSSQTGFHTPSSVSHI